MLNVFLTYIVPCSILLPIIIFLLRHRYASPVLKIVFVYLVVSAVINFSADALATLHRHNLWLLHIDTIVETIILLYFFSRIIDMRRAKKIIYFLMIVFPLACIVNLLFLQSTTNFNTYTRSIEAIMIIGFCAGYWISNSKKASTVAWVKDPVNWIISGLLLYFSSALFLFLFSNYLLQHALTSENDPIWDIVWVIHGSLLIIMYLFFAVGFNKSKP